MLLTTTNVIEGKPIQQYMGIVTAEAIIGANIFKDILQASGISLAAAAVLMKE
jgi:uncharacterized protein YbjQ (UPF0145 family)